MNIEKLFVIGAGFMGSGIVENAAVKGLNVTVYDISQKQLDRSIGGITKNLEKSVAKGRMDAADKDAALSRIKCSTEISDCCDADAIIEAVSENRDIKVSIMKEIDKYAKEDAVIEAFSGIPKDLSACTFSARFRECR